MLGPHLCLAFVRSNHNSLGADLLQPTPPPDRDSERAAFQIALDGHRPDINDEGFAISASTIEGTTPHEDGAEDGDDSISGP